MANYDNVIKGLCKPEDALGVLDNLQNGNLEKAAAGALALTQGVYDILSEDKELVKRLGIGAFVANLAVDLPEAYTQITEQKSLKGSTYLNLVADIAFLTGVLFPPLAVPMAVAGAVYTMLGIKESNKEEQKERQRQFAKFASYLNSKEAQDYMQCPNCLNIDISNPKVYENDGIIKFNINLSKPLEEDLKLKVFTVEGSATKDDYSEIPNKREFIITIPAGVTKTEQSIIVYRDGKTENKEEFLLVAQVQDYTGSDVIKILNSDNTAVGLGTIIDIEQDKCPKPTTPTFSLNFPLPSSPSVYYPVYGSGGGSSGSSLPIYGGGSSGSSSTSTTPTYIPQPDIPYIPCPDNLIENNSALVIKLNNTNSNNEIANSNETINSNESVNLNNSNNANLNNEFTNLSLVA